MGFDDDRLGRVCMSTATWLFAAGPSLGKARRRRVLGPVGTGPRLERRPQRRGRCSFPPHRRFGSKRATPERGQMLRTAVCETASNRFPAAARVARPRAWSSARRLGTPFGVRRPPWIRPRGLLSGCSLPPAADRSRRLSAPREVSRPLARHPRALASLVLGGCQLARFATRD